jgi:hypothetical protein
MWLEMRVYLQATKFEVFIAVKILTEAFWVVTSRNLVGG